MTHAKHAIRGTMKVLQELGLNKKETVDQVAERIDTNNKLVSSKLLNSKSDHSEENQILAVDPERVRNWKYSDRPSAEHGDLQAFALELKNNGQQQPCLVRRCSDDNLYDYELIAGERRWRAAKLAHLKLQVIVKNLSDHEAAICQAAENAHRKDLSDYAKGMSYATLIKSKILKAKDLENKLNLSKVQVNRLLSFISVPPEIWKVIENPSKISARTATEMRALANKGKPYIDAMISLADLLAQGKLGASNLRREVEKLISGHETKQETAEEVRSYDGRHLFTWRRDSNSNISISFPKDIRKNINKDELEHLLKNAIEDQLVNMKNEETK